MCYLYIVSVTYVAITFFLIASHIFQNIYPLMFFWKLTIIFHNGINISVLSPIRYEDEKYRMLDEKNCRFVSVRYSKNRLVYVLNFFVIFYKFIGFSFVLDSCIFFNTIKFQFELNHAIIIEAIESHKFSRDISSRRKRYRQSRSHTHYWIMQNIQRCVYCCWRSVHCWVSSVTVPFVSLGYIVDCLNWSLDIVDGVRGRTNLVRFRQWNLCFFSIFET